MSRSHAKHPAPASPHGAAIELLRQQSLTSLVQREIEHRILSGQLAPGEKLNEADLAAELSVSRGPVREAFRALEQAGLVRTEKNRGVFVRQVSLEEADEIYEVRAALEALIGRLAAKRIRPEQLERLRALAKRMQAVERVRDAEAYFPLNLEFHELLAEAAGNGALAANYRRVVNELSLYRRETLTRDAENIPISTQDHEAIIAAIAKGDAALAERLLFEHVINSRERLHRALAGLPATRPSDRRKAMNAIAKTRGARRVIGLDTVAARRELAGRFGVDHALDPAAMSEAELAREVKGLCPPEGADAVLEVCGDPQVIPAGIQFLRSGGRYVLGGVVNPGSFARIDANQLLRRLITLRGVHNYHARNLLEALDFVCANRKRFPFHDLVDSEYRLDEIGKAMKDAAGRRVLRAAIVPW